MSSFKGKGRPPSGERERKGPRIPRMEGCKSRFASRDLAETPYTAEFEEERPSRPESRMSNGTATGKWTEKEVHCRLGAPSPTQNQSNSAFVTGFFQDFEEKLMKYNLATSIQNMSNHDLSFLETVPKC